MKRRQNRFLRADKARTQSRQRVEIEDKKSCSKKHFR
nr:MAG TPA: hypothetical protein [Caudoviricetes sp.]DAZ38738.1 MAG TPA: hypothetical protein [Caudoviricetes sp.]